MKKLLLVALLCVSTAAIAEDMKANPGNDGGKSGMSFEQRKANVLQRLQKKEACVQAATTPDAMKSCFPKWKEHHEGKGGEGMEHSDK